MYDSADTIAAVATPPAEGAIGVIRLSGKQAIEILSACARSQTPVKNWRSQRLYRVEITGEKGDTLDDGLAALFRAPNSYTGEDLVEYYGHGGIFILSLIVQRFLSLGARTASPGEFTRRAFINGRIDLSQAEAVAELISAKSEQGLITARKHLEGELSKKLRELREKIVTLLSEIEAYIDFPEEDLPQERVENYLVESESIETALKKLSETYTAALAGSEGVVVVIAGAPNAGKSSLYNILTAKERAIVTPIAGTTRDALTTTFPFHGFLTTFVDTAGLRDSLDVIEREGVKRSKEWLAKADLVLWVIDSEIETPEENAEYLSKTVEPSKVFKIWNKSDLRMRGENAKKHEKSSSYAISCLTKEGIEELGEGIKRFINERFGKNSDEITLTSERHFALVKNALSALGRARMEMLAERRTELIAADLKSALAALLEILGEDISDDILDRIFSTFCIGK